MDSPLTKKEMHEQKTVVELEVHRASHESYGYYGSDGIHPNDMVDNYDVEVIVHTVHNVHWAHSLGRLRHAQLPFLELVRQN